MRFIVRIWPAFLIAVGIWNISIFTVVLMDEWTWVAALNALMGIWVIHIALQLIAAPLPQRDRSLW